MGWHCFAKKRAVRIVAAVLHYFLCCAVSTKPQKSHFKQRRMWNADSGEFLRKPYFFSNDMKTSKLKRWEKRRKKGQLSHILPASYLYSWNLLEELCKIYLILGLDAVLQFTLSLKIAGLVPFLLTLRKLSSDLLLSIAERSKQQEVGALDRASYRTDIQVQRKDLSDVEDLAFGTFGSQVQVPSINLHMFISIHYCNSV